MQTLPTSAPFIHKPPVLQPQLGVCGCKIVRELKNQDFRLRAAPVNECFHLRSHAAETGRKSKQEAVAFAQHVFGVAGGGGVKYTGPGIGAR